MLSGNIVHDYPQSPAEPLLCQEEGSRGWGWGAGFSSVFLFLVRLLLRLAEPGEEGGD